MKKVTFLTTLFILILYSSFSLASSFNGAADFSTSSYGLYYMITGGKFPTGSPPNGDNASGGTFRFITDDPNWGYAIQQWNKDDWFSENAGFALTLMNNNSILYDNNGIEDGSYGNYYNDDASGSLAGLYMGYSMSNNFDWIYATYLKLENATTFNKIIGYFDGNGYYGNLDPNSPYIIYDMNIWSAYQDDPDSNPNSWMPTNTGSFTGDVFSAKSTAGSFSWGDTGVDRVYSGWGGATDDIYRLTYSLDNPITLEAGTYFFSHDAEVVPEPTTMLLLGAGLIGFAGLGRKRFFKKG